MRGDVKLYRRDVRLTNGAPRSAHSQFHRLYKHMCKPVVMRCTSDLRLVVHLMGRIALNQCLKAARWYCPSSLHRSIPSISVHLLVSIVNDTSRYQLSAASVSQSGNENDHMSIQSSRVWRVKNPVRVRRLQHTIDLAEEVPALHDCLLSALTLERRYLSGYNASLDGQHLHVSYGGATH